MASCSTTKAATPRSSSFLQLPPELRQEIYRNVFGCRVFRMKEQIQRQQMMYQELQEGWPKTFDVPNDREHQDFVLDATRFLRSNGDYVLPENYAHSLVTALLTTSHKIYEEFLPIFYREVYIHFSIRARLPLTIHSLQPHLHHMKHLSIDFSFLHFLQQLHRMRRSFWFGDGVEEDGVKEERCC
ncbi:hypothetical protein MMC28_009152 [Mycoblastus sanguinarius]|nr:hypothetical protein [Mycoblastus sanguinarius]